MRRFAPFASFSFIVAVLSLLIAAAPAGRVVMVLKDGTSVSGELVEATPATVTVRPSAKAEPITRPWSAIKQIGGGLTREAIVDEWRKTQADKLCGDCRGDAVADCTTCSGKGVDPATAKPCDKCEGKGTTGKCRTSKCVDGKVPCPMTCLKPSDFTGTPDADGKRWKQLRGKNGGSGKVSDGHIGELMVYEDGVPVSKGKCPKCDGTSVIVDPSCKGSGLQPCAPCKGQGVVGPKCASCVAGKVACKPCGGTGLKPSESTPAAAE